MVDDMGKNQKKRISKLKPYWIAFTIISLALFTGYFYLEKAHGEELAPFLKSLELTGHFAAHYSFGILAGLIILLVFTSFRKKRLNEPLILSATVLFSHFPDIRAWYTGIFEHESWDIIFLLHTVVDEYPLLIFLYVLMDAVLIFAYYKLIKERPVV